MNFIRAYSAPDTTKFGAEIAVNLDHVIRAVTQLDHEGWTWLDTGSCCGQSHGAYVPMTVGKFLALCDQMRVNKVEARIRKR